MHIPEEDFCRSDGMNTCTRIKVHQTEEPSVDVFDSNEASVLDLRSRACKQQTDKQSMSNQPYVGQNHYVTTD